MALTVTRTFTDPPHFSPLTNCFFHNSCVACFVNGVYRWMRWEGQRTTVGDADLTDSQVRMFGSSDDGQSWALLDQSVLPIKTQWNFLFSPDGSRLLAGIHDKGGYTFDASFSGLPRSEDGGLTWTSAITQALFDSIITPGILAFSTLKLVKLPGTTTVLAFGRYDVPGGPYHVLRSIDDGLTFTPFSTVTTAFLVEYAAALSATEVVAMATGVVAYSSDGGATWSDATKPLFTSFFEPVYLGAGVVLVVGRTSGSLGAIFRSTDSGQTYAQLALLPNSSMVGSGRIQRFAESILVAQGQDLTVPSLPTWWLSEDDGVTWTEATLVGTHVSTATSSSTIITNTGTMLADLDDPLNGSREAALWRGLVDDLLTTVGTCEAFEVEPPEPPVVGAVMGIRLDCVPILSPPVCAPFCPVDPLPAEAQLVFPYLGIGGGFRSALFIFGLVSGTGLPAQPVVAMGLPAGCGATIANNNCAVVGA